MAENKEQEILHPRQNNKTNRQRREEEEKQMKCKSTKALLKFKDKENTPKIYGIITQVFGTLYAISDEIHQTFIPGRSGEIRDVIIDSLGIFTGLLICIVFLKLVHKFIDKLKQKRKIKDKNNLE